MGLPKTFPPAAFYVELEEYNTSRTCSGTDCSAAADYHACIPTDQERGWFAWVGHACADCLSECNFVGDPPDDVNRTHDSA